jgi:hypothetical protein
LEEALLPVVQGAPHVINVHFVDADRKVVDTLVLRIPVPTPAPRNRRVSRWRPRE